jgi:hypothetical protein
MRPKKRFGLNGSNQSGHYIFTLWLQRLLLAIAACHSSRRRCGAQ